MKKYERVVWTRILDLYKNHAHLWDKKNANYSNRVMREDSFSMLLDIYKELDDEVTVECLKSKIINLRTCFFREIRKVKATLHRESGSKYVPTLWYYEQMMFLVHRNESLPSSADNINETIYLEEFSQSGSEQSQDAHSVPNKKLRHNVRRQIEQEHGIITDHKLMDKKDQKRELFAKCFAIQLHDVDDE